MDYYLEDALDLDFEECARAHGLLDDVESDDSDSGKSELDDDYYKNRLSMDEDDYQEDTVLIKADLSRITLDDTIMDSDHFKQIESRGPHEDDKPRNRFSTYAMAVTGQSSSLSNQFAPLESSSDEEEIVNDGKLDSTSDVATNFVDPELSNDLPIDDDWQKVSYKKSSKKFATISERNDSKRNTPSSASEKPGTHQEVNTEDQRATHSNHPATQKKLPKKQQQDVSKKSGMSQKKKHPETVQQKLSAHATTKKKKKKQQKISHQSAEIDQKVKQPQTFSNQLDEVLSNEENKKDTLAKNVEPVVPTELDVYVEQLEPQNIKSVDQYNLYAYRQCMDFINTERESCRDDMFEVFTSERGTDNERITQIWARSRIKPEENRRRSIEEKMRSFFQAMFNCFLRLFGGERLHGGIYQGEYNLEPLVTLVMSEIEGCCVPNKCTLQPFIADMD